MIMCLFLSATVITSVNCYIPPSISRTVRIKHFVADMGYKPNTEAIEAIIKASETYDLNPAILARIAMIESGFDSTKVRYNSNGSIDLGLLQVNSVHWHEFCSEFDVHKVEGNAMCAGKLLSELKKKWADKDPQWIARYHSRTYSKKNEYWRRYASL